MAENVEGGARGRPTTTKGGASRRKRGRRTKTSHPGVKLRSRTWASGEVTWFARWVDPDTHKETDTNLTKLGLRTDAARVDWARRKSRDVAQRKADLDAGATPRANKPLKAALLDYLDHVAQSKEPKTLLAYRTPVERFLEWADGHGLQSTDDVRTTDLAAWRESLLTVRARLAVKGGKRGARAAGGKKLSPGTVNSYLGTLTVALNYLRRIGQLSRIPSGEAIKEALRRVREPRRPPKILTPHQVRDLLLACEGHDAATFKLTRNEHDGEGEPGTTPRYVPVMPFVVWLLLSGCRVGEGLSLEWGDVDLDALDVNGRVVGEVVIDGERCKTGDTRTVDLAPTPVLRELLAALQRRAVEADGAALGRVFPELTEASVKAALRRLLLAESKGGFGAPTFSWHVLRKTCGTYLCCAPSIYGSAAVFLAARRLGHSVAIAERHYLHAVRGIDPAHRTLEDVLGVADLCGSLVERIGG